MALARHATAVVEADPTLVLRHTPESLNICFEVRQRKSCDITEALHDRGLAMVGTGAVKGNQTIRLICVNPAMTTADIDVFFAAVREVAADLPAESVLLPGTKARVGYSPR